MIRREILGAYAPLLFFCLGTSTLFVSLYLKDVESELNFENGLDSIGIATSSTDEVSRRPSRRLLWSPLTQNQPIFENDTIRTGPSGKTNLSLGDLGKVELGPNSLAVIESKNDSFQIDLASGDLFLSGNIDIKIGKTKIKSQDGNINIKRDWNRSSLEVTAESGTVNISTDEGTKKTLTTGERLIQNELSQNSEIKKVPFVIKLPNRLEAYELSEFGNVEIPFKIEVLDKGFITSDTKLEFRIYNSKSDKTILKRVPLISMDAPLLESFKEAGTFYFDLVDSNNPEISLGDFSTFTIKDRPLPPPALVNLELGFKLVDLKPMENNFENGIAILENTNPDLQSFEIKWDSEMKEATVQKIDTQLNAAQASQTIEWKFKSELLGRSKGTLNYRGIAKNGEASSWKLFEFDPERFRYGENLKQSPKLISPPAQKIYNASALSESTLRFEWSALESKYFKPEGYTFYLEAESLTRGEKFLNLEIVVNKNSYVLEKLPPAGKFKWWVKPLWQNSNPGAQSASRIFELKSAPGKSQIIRAPTFIFEESGK